MVKVTKFINAKFMSAKTAGEFNGKKLVIDSAFEEKMQDDSVKLCIRFKGVDKPLALNQTNLTILMSAYGEDSDAWINNTVILRLVNVTYNGQVVLGIQLEPITK